MRSGLAARRSRERNDADNRSREEQAPRQNGDTHRYEHGTARSSRGLGDKGQGKENPRSFGDRNPEAARPRAPRRAAGGPRHRWRAPRADLPLAPRHAQRGARHDHGVPHPPRTSAALARITPNRRSASAQQRLA